MVPMCVYSKCMNFLQPVLVTKHLCAQVINISAFRCSSFILPPEGTAWAQQDMNVSPVVYLLPCGWTVLSLSLSLITANNIAISILTYISLSSWGKVFPVSTPGRGITGLAGMDMPTFTNCSPKTVTIKTCFVSLYNPSVFTVFCGMYICTHLRMMLKKERCK